MNVGYIARGLGQGRFYGCDFVLQLAKTADHPRRVLALLDHGHEALVRLASLLQPLTVNQIARGQHERLEFAWSGDERTDLALKRDFIAKARRDLGVDPSWTWEIINIDDLQGPRLAGIYRAVRILYELDQRFAQDVESYCQAYFDGMREKPADSRLALAMGRLFVLEEVAINIHLRCVAGYRDEFYTGAFLPVILNLYEGRYARDPWFLARAPRSPVRFHEWDGETWSARLF